MKGNYQNLVALTNEVERIEQSKEDYLYSTKDIQMIDDETFSLNKHHFYFTLNKNAHQQLASRLDIPFKYYTKMLEIPNLRSDTINTWFQNKPEKRLVRTLDGKVRAFLSDKFKPVDNFLILSGFLPVINKMDVKVKSCTLTENKMYIQIVFPKIAKEITPGDIVQLGIILTNSEVGRGAIKIKTVIWRLICENGMVGENIINKYHVGRRVGDYVQDYDIFKADTIKAELESFKKRLKDELTASMNYAYLQTIVQKLRKSSEDEIDDVHATVGNVTKRYGFTENEKNSITLNMGRYYSNEHNVPTRWHLSNSITALAHEIDNKERQYEIEKIGYDIATMKEKQWHQLNVMGATE